MRYVSMPKGGTLSKIAQQENISLKAILFTNGNLDPRRIHIGQKIAIPETEDDLLAITQTRTKQIRENVQKQRDVPMGNEPRKKCSCKRKTKPWTISQKGINFLKNYETLKLKMYNDSANHATIGYGHLIHHGPISGKKSEKPFIHGLTEEEATKLLKKDLEKYEGTVNKYVNVPLCQQEYDALVIFCFNIGQGAFSKCSALRVLNQKKYFMVGNKMKLYNRAGGKISKGLVNRRAEEVEIFEKGDYVRTR